MSWLIRVLVPLAVALSAMSMALNAHARTATSTVLMMPNRDAMMNTPVVVWGVSTQAAGTAFVLDFGDGSTPVTGTLTADGTSSATTKDRSYIAFSKTYTARGRYTATLVVGNESDTVTLQVFDPSYRMSADAIKQLETNMAIQDGLRYQWTAQNSRAANFPTSLYTNWGTKPSSEAGLVALAFQNQGYRLPKDGSEPSGLYERFVVRRAINYILSTFGTQTLAVETGTGGESLNPCVGYGVRTTPFWVTNTVTVETGAKTFTASSGLGFQPGTRVRASDSANPSRFVEGEVATASATSLTLNVDVVGGSGAASSWVIRAVPTASSTSATIGTGAKSFTSTGGLGFAPGTLVQAFSSANPGLYVQGTVTASGATTLSINATATGGTAGTSVSDWNIVEVVWTGADCAGIRSTGGEPGYEQGLEMLALAATGALGRINNEVTGFLQGKTYAEILHRLANTLTWAMGNSGNGEGSWYYSFNSTTGDGSTIGWAILAMLDAEAAGVYLPPWVRTQFLKGFKKILNNDGSIDYTADNSGSSLNSTGPEKNGIALQGMFFAGATSVVVGGGSTVSVATSRNLISSWWSGSGGIGNNSWGGCSSKNKGCAYTMFNNFKGLSLQGITSLPSFTSGSTTYPAVADWKQEYQDWLIQSQTQPTATTTSAKTISAITAGSSTVVTSTAHGFPVGARVAIASTTGTGATLLNSKLFTIKAVTTNTFTLAVDTTGFAFGAAGTATRTTVAGTDGGNWAGMYFSCCYNTASINAAVAEIILSPAALVLPDETIFSNLGLENVGGINTRLQGASPRQSHSVVATASSSSGTPVAAVSVTFEITSGPNAGLTDTINTGSDGKATWTYADALPSGSAGVDVIRAKIGETLSNSVSVTWISNAPSYTVSGSISGLRPGKIVTLLNTSSATCGASNCSELIDVTGPQGGGAAAFSFNTALPSSANYTVSIEVQPTGQSCSVTGNDSNSGSGPFSNVTNVAITCVDTAFTVGGTLSGLGSGSVTVRNSVTAGGVTTTSDRTLFANGSFEFLGLVNKNSDWAVTILTEPSGHKCSLANASGTNIQASVANVSVTCVTATLAKLSADPQSAAANAAVAAPPSVQLMFGNTPLSGVTITFTVSGASSTIAAGGSSSTSSRTVVTDANGVATLTSWTLGIASASSTVVTASAPNSVTTPSGTVTGIASVAFTATAFSTATKLVLNAPADIIRGGARAAYTVTLQDANSTAVPAAAGGQVVYLFASGSGGTFYDAATGGNTITSVTIPAGQSSASFYFMGVIQAYTITASDATPANGATGLADGSDSISVTAGSAAALAFTTQPNGGSAQTAWTQQPVVQVQDAYGNNVSTTSSITLVLTTANGASLACTNNTVAASSGAATFAGCKVDKAGTYTLTAASLGLTSAQSNSFTITVGAATKLAFSSQPNGGVAGVVWTGQPSVSVQDAGGNTVTSAANSISIALTTAGGATLTCTATTQAASAGLANFAGCKVNLGGTYTLTATATGLTSAVSNSFTATGDPAKLGFTVQPGGGAANAAWANQPKVAVQDAAGNTIVDSTAPVTLALTTPAGAVLQCTSNPTSAATGVASFAGCRVDKSGTYTLTATSPGLTNAVSNSFSITVGPANKLAFTVQPSGTQPGVAWSTQPTVTVQDAGGNTVTGSSALVSLAITSANGASLTCTATAVLASSGVAAFTGCKIDTEGTYTLTASSPTLAGATSNTLYLWVPAKLGFTAQPGGGQAGSGWGSQPTVAIQSASGATVPNASAAVTLALTTPNGAVLTCAGNPVNASSGLAAFSGCKVDKVGTYTLTASSPSLTNAVSSQFTITPGAAASLAFTTQPDGGPAGVAFQSQPALIVRDASGNTVTGFASTVSLSLLDSNGAAASGGATLTCTTNPVTPALGVAAFAGCRVNQSGAYRLQAQTAGIAAVSSNLFSIRAVEGVQITTPELPNGVTAVKYGFELRARGGIGPYTFAVTAGALPAGVTLRSTGNFEGMPSGPGSFNFTVTVSDSIGNASSRTFDVSVSDALAISTSFLTEGLVGGAYRSPQEVLGGVLPFVWTIASGALPQGLRLNPATGEISGVPAAQGDTNFTLMVTDRAGSQAVKPFRLTVNQPTTVVPVANNNLFTLVGGKDVVGQPCAATATVTVVSAANTPTKPASVDELPWGLLSYDVTVCPGGSVEVLLVYPEQLPRNAQFWKWGPTPSNANNHWYVLPGVLISGNTARFTVVDGGLGDDDLTANGRIIDPGGVGISMLDLAGNAPNGTVSSPYSGSLSVSNGTGPFVWSIAAGALPPGLSLASTSTAVGASTNSLTGTPTASGTYGFTAQVIDESGTNLIATKNFVVEVGAAGGATYTVTPVVTPAQGGSLTPNTPQQAASGTLKAFLITESAGYYVTGASGCGGSLVGNLFTTDVINANCSVTVTFAALPVNQTAQSIVFAPIADQLLGVAPFLLTATASSGLPVQYTVSGACVLSGAATLVITGTGSCTVQADQPGDSTYAAAAPVTRVFQITAGAGAPVAALLSLNSPADLTVSGPAASYQVTRRDSANSPVGGASLRVYLTASCAGGYFKVGGATAQYVDIGAGLTSASFEFHSTSAGVCTVTASDASPPNGATGLADATDQISVTSSQTPPPTNPGTTNPIPTFSAGLIGLLALMLAALGLRRRLSFQ